jgi:hypothetical protein
MEIDLPDSGTGEYRIAVMSLAHDSSMTEYLDVNTTSNRILAHFYWPNVRRDVAEDCRYCNTCQVIGKLNQTLRGAPLRPVSAFEESFSKIMVECVGLLSKTK